MGGKRSSREPERHDDLMTAVAHMLWAFVCSDGLGCTLHDGPDENGKFDTEGELALAFMRAAGEEVVGYGRGLHNKDVEKYHATIKKYMKQRIPTERD